jgi:CRP/FNR family transcriptional regulator
MHGKVSGCFAESSDEDLQPAQSRDNLVGSPCAACPVRPLSICSGLSIDELSDLEKIVANIVVKAGAPIFDEGEAATHRYNLTSGCIRIYKLLGDGRRQIIGFLFPGDFLGLAIKDEYAYGAEAVVESHLCHFPQRDFEDLISRYPTLEKRLLGVTKHELAIAQEQMVLLGRKSAEEKVVTMLLTFSRRAQHRGQSENPVFLPMTREDLGDYLGLTTETVSRTMTQLKTKGVIRLENDNHVRLIDMEKIIEMAEGF